MNMTQRRTFTDWYQENKSRLSAQRKARYQSDPEYRKQAVQRAAEYRSRTRAMKPSIDGLVVKQVCEHLEISAWTLHKWGTLGYYPPPSRIEGRIVFTPSQLELLGLIKQFFVQHPRRAAAKHRDKLVSLIDVIHHNWSVNE
jgi:hypothetical protein